MENPIFRKKSIERISSPEQLNDYIRVTNPGVWVILSAVLILLAGFIVWGVVGKIETKVNTVAVSDAGTVVCYVREADFSAVGENDVVRLGDGEYRILTISKEPQKVGNDLSEYGLRVGGLTKEEWVYKVTLSNANLPDGVYGAAIVTDSVSPITFLFN